MADTEQHGDCSVDNGCQRERRADGAKKDGQSQESTVSDLAGRYRREERTYG